MLLNARTVTNSDGYVRKVSLEFGWGNTRKQHHIALLPGMTKEEVADSLRKSAEEIDATADKAAV